MKRRKPARAVRAAKLPRIGGIMFDVDGTLLLGDRSLGSYEVLPGAIEVLEDLRRRGIPYVLLTNGSAYPPARQAAKLRNIGLPVDDAQMLTPSNVTAELMTRNGVRRALVLGTEGVGWCLREAGIHTLAAGDSNADDVDAVYVGWHPGCGMADIEAACKAIWHGAKLYVASNVPFFATKQGRTIGYSFAIVAAIRAITKAPIILTGKPSMHALRTVAQRLGIRPREVAVVGDDPWVETSMARRAGGAAFAVTTGTTSAEEWAKQPASRRPHRVLNGIQELIQSID
jgi:HAD superfamily hydrolase (TIGR01450 family)